MKRVLVIDNYDSFTYNLVHYLEQLNCDVLVMRNDEIEYSLLNDYHKIILSPGSGLPYDAGELTSFIKEFASSKSMLGICLGQQAIAEVFGGELQALDVVKHGEVATLTHFGNDVIYEGIAKSFDVGLYFSWKVKQIPDSLTVTAKSADGIIMSLKHKHYDLRALQYHPESIMTKEGLKILSNWLRL